LASRWATSNSTASTAWMTVRWPISFAPERGGGSSCTPARASLASTRPAHRSARSPFPPCACSRRRFRGASISLGWRPTYAACSSRTSA
jgi:hypothetical protein